MYSTQAKRNFVEARKNARVSPATQTECGSFAFGGVREMEFHTTPKILPVDAQRRDDVYEGEEVRVYFAENVCRVAQ